MILNKFGYVLYCTEFFILIVWNVLVYLLVSWDDFRCNIKNGFMGKHSLYSPPKSTAQAALKASCRQEMN